MRTRLKLKPGQRGTKRLLEQYGDRLVCVRYRYDEEQEKRFKTVELIVEEVEWKHKSKRIPPEAIVAVRIVWGETELAWQVKQAGGKWNRQRQVWEMRYDRVVGLGLEGRMVSEEASNSRGR